MAHDIRDLADEEVMQLVQRGDPRAFELLYDRHGGAAFSLAYRIAGKQAAAEDVVQEALLSIWRSRLRYDQTRGSVRTWILGIVHNRAIDGLRRSTVHDRRRETLDVVEERFEARERTDVEVARREEARNVRGALDTLPDEQRKTIELAYFGGFTPHADRGDAGRAGRDGEGPDAARTREDEARSSWRAWHERSRALSGRRRRLPPGRAERPRAPGVRAPPARLRRVPGGARAAAAGGRRAAGLRGAVRAAAGAEGIADGGGGARGAAPSSRAARAGRAAAAALRLRPALWRRSLLLGLVVGFGGRPARRRRRARTVAATVDKAMPQAGGELDIAGDDATLRLHDMPDLGGDARLPGVAPARRPDGARADLRGRRRRTRRRWTSPSVDDADGVYVTREARGGAQVPSEDPIVSVPL